MVFLGVQINISKTLVHSLLFPIQGVTMDDDPNGNEGGEGGGA